MFVNLMDLNLQDKIANTDKHDFDVKNTLELLLENRPNSLRQDLEDWCLEKHGNRNILFYKDKNYIPEDLDLWQDTWGNWKHIILSNNITGGQGCEPLLNDMCKDAGYVSNLRSTRTHHTRLIYLSKEQNQ